MRKTRCFNLAPGIEKSRGVTLVETMVATLIFALAAAGVTGTYMRSMKSTTTLRYSTTAASAALNILEQVRILQYANLKTLHDSATSSTTIPVLIADPNAAIVSGVPVGYRQISLNLNVLDGVTQLNATWTPANIPMEKSTTAATLQMQFWLTLKQDVSTVAPIVETMELALIYQWKPPGYSGSGWQTGTIHSLVPNQSPRK